MKRTIQITALFAFALAATIGTNIDEPFGYSVDAELHGSADQEEQTPFGYSVDAELHGSADQEEQTPFGYSVDAEIHG